MVLQLDRHPGEGVIEQSHQSLGRRRVDYLVVDGPPGYRSARVLTLVGSVPVIYGPTFAQNKYNASFGFWPGITHYFLTHRMDRYSRAMLFNYETTPQNW